MNTPTSIGMMKLERQLLSDTEASNFIGVSRKHIWHMAKTVEGFPQPIRLGSRFTRWKISELRDWVNKL